MKKIFDFYCEDCRKEVDGYIPGDKCFKCNGKIMMALALGAKPEDIKIKIEGESEIPAEVKEEIEKDLSRLSQTIFESSGTETDYKKQ